MITPYELLLNIKYSFLNQPDKVSQYLWKIPILIIHSLEITQRFYPEIIRICRYLHFRLYTKNKAHTPGIKNIANLPTRPNNLSNTHFLLIKKLQKSYWHHFSNLIAHLGVISLPILSKMYGHDFSSKRRWHVNMATLFCEGRYYMCKPIYSFIHLK